MDADSWSARLSSASRRYQSAFQSRSGMKWENLEAEMLMGFEELDVDDDIREEFPCCFCSEYFDIVGLCCHIDDEHPVEAKNGLVNIEIWSRVVEIRGKILGFREAYMQRKRKSRRPGSHSTLSLLRKELREGNLQSLFGGSSCVAPSTSTAPDPLLSSFILPMGDDFKSAQTHSPAETIPAKKSSVVTASESFRIEVTYGTCGKTGRTPLTSG
ncbi:hypothetical protein KY285_002591 [Solanum tuberosum]|nr:hypothetical protein KY285_002591 [Solanum tuberosum]